MGYRKDETKEDHESRCAAITGLYTKALAIEDWRLAEAAELHTRRLDQRRKATYDAHALYRARQLPRPEAKKFGRYSVHFDYSNMDGLTFKIWGDYESEEDCEVWAIIPVALCRDPEEQLDEIQGCESVANGVALMMDSRDVPGPTIETKMLADALEQYVQNTEEVEKQLNAEGKAKLEAARKMQERVTEIFTRQAT